MHKTYVKNLLQAHDFLLDLHLLQGTAGLERVIAHPRVQKSGLILCGLLEAAHANRIQVFGNTELLYLRTLPLPAAKHALVGLMQVGIPCIILTSQQQLAPEMLATVAEYNIPVLQTALSSATLINRLHSFLDEELGPEVSQHGVMVDVFGVGVLHVGASGIGKSECALDLVLRGHRLVADDVVLIRRREQELFGICSAIVRHHMEIRGLGIINIHDLFGATSVAPRKRLDLVVELVEWRHHENYERLGLDGCVETFLGLSVAKVRLPIHPGRNIASIVEVAARNQLLKRQGYDSVGKFQADLEAVLRDNQS